MHSPARLIPLVAAALFLSGCVGTGPNTQQGAATGGFLGAVAGGMIAGSQYCGDPVAGALIGGVVGALAGGAIGNSIDHQNGTVYGQPVAPYPASYQTQVAQSGPPAAPPPPNLTDEMPPAPGANALWIPGFWNYTTNGYIWAPGHWELPPPTARFYVAAHWENRGGNYAFVSGYWQ